MTPESDIRTTAEADPQGPETGQGATAVRQALTESHQHVLSYLQRRLGSSDEARDVMQSFMLRAIDHAEALQDVRTVRGWLSRVLSTSIADHQRGAARRRQRETLMSPTFFDESEAAEAELDGAVCACLHALIATLKPDQTDLIRRIDLNEEPREKVAADLQLSLATLSVRLHRARTALKKRLVEMCLTCPKHGFLDCGCDTVRRADLVRAAAEAKLDL